MCNLSDANGSVNDDGDADPDPDADTDSGSLCHL
jgi:hypothetical protein